MENTQTTLQNQNPEQQPNAVAASAAESTNTQNNNAELLAKLDEIVEKRTQGIVKSILKDNGVEDSEIGELVAKYKESKKQAREKDIAEMQNLKTQKQALETELLSMKLYNNATTVASEIGLDTKKLNYVMKLADLKDVVVNNNVDNVKLKEALTKVLTDIPEFKATSTQVIRKVGAEGQEPETIDALSKWRKAIGLNTENK